MHQLAGGARLCVAGVGPQRGTQAAQRAVAAGAGALVSCGLAGGLDPALGSGSLITPRRVVDTGDDTVYHTEAAWRRQVRSLLACGSGGSLLSTTDPVTDAAHKARLRQRYGAAAVDMESAAIAAVAARHSLPFLALRVIVDPAATALPRAATVALDGDGRPRPLHLLGALLRRPREVAALWELARYNRLAGQSLAHLSQRLNRRWSPP